MQFDVSDADLVLVNPANDTMDSDAVVERPGKKIKTQREYFIFHEYTFFL